MKPQQKTKISTFFRIFLDPGPRPGPGGCRTAESPAQWTGPRALNGKISYLRRFREIRGHQYLRYHQNHGLDVGRARYFGPMRPGFEDMAEFASKSRLFNVLCKNGPKQAVLGRKTGMEATRGHTARRPQWNKVAGCPYGLCGKGFAAF